MHSLLALRLKFPALLRISRTSGTIVCILQLSMNTFQNAVAIVFLMALTALAVISVFGVWDLLGKDVIFKSLQTLGVLAAVSVVVMMAGRFIDPTRVSVSEIGMPHPLFQGIRQGTLGLLIVAASLLALIGVLAIWEVIPNQEVLMKALSSVAIIAFSSFLAVAVCLEREKHPIILRQGGTFSAGSILAILGLVWILVTLVN